MTKYVKLNGNSLETLTNEKALNYLDEEELNNAGYKEFVPATKEQGKPYRYSYEETATQIIEHVEEIIPEPDEDIREQQFKSEFFETSLGWVRRKVTMNTGEIKDFLSELLPAIKTGLELQQPVHIIVYDEPDYTQEISDWTIYQHVVTPTPQFIQECLLQLSNDFLPFVGE